MYTLQNSHSSAHCVSHYDFGKNGRSFRSCKYMPPPKILPWDSVCMNVCVFTKNKGFYTMETLSENTVWECEITLTECVNPLWLCNLLLV